MLSVKATTSHQQPRLVLAGELTIYTAAQARSEILLHLDKHENLEIDLHGIQELDTAGVQVLLWLKRSAAAQGKSLPFTYHSPAVVEVFDLLRVGGIFGDPVLLDAPAQGEGGHGTR